MLKKESQLFPKEAFNLLLIFTTKIAKLREKRIAKRQLYFIKWLKTFLMLSFDKNGYRTSILST